MTDQHSRLPNQTPNYQPPSNQPPRYQPPVEEDLQIVWHDPSSLLADVIRSGLADQVGLFFRQLPPEQWALPVSRLDEHDRSQLFEMITPELAAELVQELTDAQAIDVFEIVSSASAAAILEELESDQQADVLVELDRSDAEAILAAMDPGAAARVRQLANYHPETAGGLMITELLSFSANSTVDDVLNDLRANNELYSDYEVQYAYVIAESPLSILNSGASIPAAQPLPFSPNRSGIGSRDSMQTQSESRSLATRGEDFSDESKSLSAEFHFGRLVGVLRLRDLLLSSPEKPIAELMIGNPLSVDVTSSLDQLVDFFDQHSFLGVPVVNQQGNLLGVVRKHDLEAARADRADDDNLKLLGIVGGEELRTMPLVSRTVKRLSWLIPNIMLNLLAVSVIAVYESTIEQVVALAILLPLISDMGGNAGVQAIAVSIRELNQGLVRAHELVWVAIREASVGIFSGLVLGSVIAVGAFLWKQNIYLAVVMGAAMLLNNIVATVVGGLMPLILKRFKVDPALASGPLLTTVTDMTGFALVLSLASLVLPKLIE